MPRPADRKPKVKKVVLGKPVLSEADRAAIGVANGLGLYVLFEGPLVGRRWRVYDRTTGSDLATVDPATGRATGHHRAVGTFRAAGWREALAGVRDRFDARD